MIRLILFLSFFLSMTSATFSQQPPIENGVPQALAIWRAKHYSDVRYKLNITLEKGAPLMKGDIEIRVTLTDEGAKYPLVLDWRTTQFANDKDKPFANVVSVNDALDIRSQLNNEHILIPNGLLKKGENIVKIQFASPIKPSGSAITRYIDKEDGSEYIYSLFVPSDASTAFPVFDQPDLKARFSLTVDAPKEWKVVSNTDDQPQITISGHSYGQASKKESIKESKMKGIEWKFFQTKPISTYVFAFAAGDFTIFEEGKTEILKNQGNTIESLPNNPKELEEYLQNLVKEKPRNNSLIFLRKSQDEKFKPHAEEVFRLNRECVKYLEEYFDYKFPFPKYDLVLIPEFPFGGMEHAGATFLREASIIFPSEPTKNDYISRATLIFHEAAHQWFGDTVTMKWFDDLWLKEGFATFMGFKALEKIMPEHNAWKAFYERNKQAAYQTDSTKGTTPIYQEIPNLSAAKSAYGAIVYSKAPSFLKQAEFYLGEKEFQTAVRSFLKKYEFKNATWQDLVTEFEVASKKRLQDWANAWVKQRGLPIITLGVKNVHVGNPPKDAFYENYLIQKGNLREQDFWQVKTNVLIRVGGGNETKAVISSKSEGVNMRDSSFIGQFWTCCNKITKDALPDLIFPNYQDYGYGIFLLDEKSRKYILANVQNEKDDFLRAMMYGSLWDSVREAELNPKDYVELVIKNVAAEKDETIVSSMLGRANTALNYYLDDKTRESLAPKLEEILMGKMNTAETMGQRVTFYRAFLNVASSEKSRTVLKDMLKATNKPEKVVKEISDTMRNGYINFVPLKTKDKFDIVTKLFILGDKDSENLLAELVKTETSDDAKRYAYAARAGIATAENKAKFWNDFVNNKEISESWIEAAFVPFNSVKHSNLTLQFLEKALAELPNHKKNRKIFFVNGWLGAFIGGQKSEEALNIVNKFLADNPNLDKDLRLKILENVDVIERAVKIRKTFGKG